MNITTLTEQRRAELEKLSPWARFEIPSADEGLAYRYSLEQLLGNMVSGFDERNRFNRVSFNEESGVEGGVGMVYMANGELIIGCKLYWFDGTPVRTPCSWPKGLLFRDHEDKGVYTVHGVLLLADALADFLRAKRTRYKLFVRHRSHRDEICRSEFQA